MRVVKKSIKDIIVDKVVLLINTWFLAHENVQIWNGISN